MSQPLFPFIVQHDQARAAERDAGRVADHITFMRCCWPDWHGPKVDPGIDGLCSVHECIVFNLTHNENRYHYMAPCRIESVSQDGLTVTAVIDYGPDSVCSHYNGERLRLDITAVWPPVAHLIALHRQQDRGL